MAVAPVRVRFETVGSEAVLAAFASVSKRAEELGRKQSKEILNGIRASQKAANDTGKATAAASERATAIVIAGNNKQDASATKLQAKLVSLANKAEAAQVSAANRAADAQVRAQQKEAQAAQKAFDVKLKAQQKAEAAMSATAEREANRRAKAEERANRQASKAQEREDRIAAKLAAREVNDAQKKNRGRAGTVANVFGKAGRSTFNTVEGIAAGVGVVGGGYMLGNAIQEGIAAQKQAALISNSVTMGDNITAASMQPDELIKKARGVSTTTGIGMSAVLDSMAEVADKGGGAAALEVYLKDMDDLGKTAVSTGTKLEALGAIYAASLQAGVKPGEQMRSLIRSMAESGKYGNVELADFAPEIPKILGAMSRTELTGEAAVSRSVGLAQIAVKQKVSPEESRTSITDLTNDISTHSKNLNALGVKVYGASGLQRDPAEIVAEAVRSAFTTGVKERDGKVVKGADAIFGGAKATFNGNSLAILNQAVQTYLKSGGGLVGENAIKAEIEESGGHKMSEKARDQQYARVMSTDAAKLDVGMAEFKAKIATLLPEITKMLPSLLQVAKYFADFAVMAGQHPFASVFALMGANLGKEIAGAGIGQAVKAALLKELAFGAGGGGGGAGGIGGLGPAVGGGRSLVGSAANLAVIGAAAYGAGSLVGEFGAVPEFDDAASGGRKALATSETLRSRLYEYRQKAKAGTLNDVDRGKMQQYANVARGLGDAVGDVQDPSGWNAVNPVAYYDKWAFNAGGGGSVSKEGLGDLAAQFEKLAAKDVKIDPGSLATLGTTVGNAVAAVTSNLSNPGNAARGGTSPANRVSLGH